MPALYVTKQLAGWKQVTEVVHTAGGKIVVQLGHAGRISHTSLQADGTQPDASSVITAKTKTVELVAFGRIYNANLDLVERLKRGGLFNEGDRTTYYGGGAHG